MIKVLKFFAAVVLLIAAIVGYIYLIVVDSVRGTTR